MNNILTLKIVFLAIITALALGYRFDWLEIIFIIIFTILLILKNAGKIWSKH